MEADIQQFGSVPEPKSTEAQTGAARLEPSTHAELPVGNHYSLVQSDHFPLKTEVTPIEAIVSFDGSAQKPRQAEPAPGQLVLAELKPAVYVKVLRVGLVRVGAIRKKVWACGMQRPVCSSKREGTGFGDRRARVGFSIGIHVRRIERPGKWRFHVSQEN